MVEQYSHNVFYLVRHGEAETNVRNVVSSDEKKKTYSLTERGRAQIEETAEYLKQYELDFMVMSPVHRTRETTEILNTTLSLPVSVDQRLCEAHFGQFEGSDIKTFLDFMQEHGGRLAGEPELGVEGYMDIRERVKSFLKDVSAHFTGKHIVIVSHGDTLQEIYGELMQLPVGPSQTHWYPAKGSCMIVSKEKTEEFLPKH